MSPDVHNNGNTQGQLFVEEIVAFLKTKNLTPKLLETHPACRVEIEGKNFTYACYILVKHNVSTLVFYFISPIQISEKQYLLPVAEFIARANYGMLWGSFEMDFSDGEVRYKKEITWRENPVQMSQIWDVLRSGVGMWDLYIRSLSAIIYEDITPEEAIDRVGGLE